MLCYQVLWSSQFCQKLKKANKLIEQVSSAIDLELKNGSGASVTDVPIENVENLSIKRRRKNNDDN
ncbi:hypothetical protein [Lachnobacterium bovis]|uniref:hypothetical protein n=1 Tax=Lachnobacterium bovis TaxID=140626 RepID=UPI001FA70206|nr:hypothetical protein [Lachnobacterium bovis]